jgi:hypothetical protein
MKEKKKKPCLATVFVGSLVSGLMVVCWKVEMQLILCK